jgi:alpha-tubulin suppressor-like RCC1 family protein
MGTIHITHKPVFRAVTLVLIFCHTLAAHASLVREWGYLVANPVLPDSLPIVQINSGGDHILALTSAGHLVIWGYNSDGQAVAPAGTPVFTKIAGGGYHSLALRPDGTVLAWGYNFYGQTNVPIGLANVAGIAARDDVSGAVLSNGTVVVWGNAANYGLAPSQRRLQTLHRWPSRGIMRLP